LKHKPPAFQFYVKDWRSSGTIHQMTRQEIGDYITLLAAAWDSDDPGTLPLPVEIAAKCAGTDPRVVRNFLAKYPHTFIESNGRLVNEKLRAQYLELLQFHEKAHDRAKAGAAARWKGNASSNASSIEQAMLNDASALALASATAIATKNKEQKHSSSPGGDGVRLTFDAFWRAYPRKVGKGAAVKAWSKIKPNDELQQKILTAIEAQKKTDQWSRDGGQYIPHPATWLNAARWDDEIQIQIEGGRFNERTGGIKAEPGKYANL
jgi:hypothetical protein